MTAGHWLIEGLELLGKIANTGALDAIKEGIHTITEGVHGKTTPEIVLDNLKALDHITADNAAAAAELHAKYHPTD